MQHTTPQGVERIFVRQASQLGLGHAILCAERAVGDEPFAVLLADDFITDNVSDVTSELVRLFYASQKIQLAAIKINDKSIENYGVIIPSKTKNGVDGIVEKPAAEMAPSNYASIGRYILTPDIFEIISKLPKGAGNEIQLADAIHYLAVRGKVNFMEISGKRFDCGSVTGFANAFCYEWQKRTG